MKLSQAVSYVRDHGIRSGAILAADRLLGREPGEASYAQWLSRNRLSSHDYQKMEKTPLSHQPRIGVIASMEAKDRTAFFQSLNLQIYRNFTALKKEPLAEFILAVNGPCTISPNLLWECARRLSEEDGQDIGLIYFDSDVIGEDGHKCHPSFRPDFDPDLLSCANYMGNVVLVRADLAREASGPDFGTDAFYRFLKKVCLRNREGEKETVSIAHIPKVLYHDAAEYDAQPSDREECVQPSPMERPLISVLIPNKDHAADLRRCVDSLLTVNTWSNLEILILENHSEEEETFALYRELEASDARIRVLTWDKPFNYSAINNHGAAFAKGEYLLLLNNDTCILEPESIARMYALASKPCVGAVGALLLYPDNRVQHAGIILGHGGIAGHAWEGESPAEPMEPFSELVFSHTHNVSAVTGACMLLKTSFYKGVGGMDESLAVTFNDVDLCMRLRSEGLRILMCPQACLLHDESASRGSENTPQKVARFHEEIRIFVHRWQAELEKGDPFYNPNLTLVGRSWTAKDELREDRKPYRQYLHL